MSAVHTRTLTGFPPVNPASSVGGHEVLLLGVKAVEPTS